MSGLTAALAELGRHREIVELDALRAMLHAEADEPDERVFHVGPTVRWPQRALL